MMTSTIDLVRAARAKNPDAAAADMAREIGVSRERIRQALVKLGLPTRVRKGPAIPLNPDERPALHDLPPHILTSVCETLVCADLLARGWDTYRSIDPHAACALVALRDDRVIRVAVRPVKMVAGTAKRIGALHGQYDTLALVWPEGQIEYQPALTY